MKYLTLQEWARFSVYKISAILELMSAQRKFCEEIWHWFSVHKRALPWRDLEIADDTQRAYMILVSEIMLQQTQVSRVEVIFRRFLREFPTIHDLAKASNAQVIRSWRGMGYNSRALRLRDATKLIVGKALSEKIDNGKLTIDNCLLSEQRKVFVQVYVIVCVPTPAADGV